MLHIETWKRWLIWGLAGLGLLMALPNGFYGQVEARNDAILAIEKGADTPENQDLAKSWPALLPSTLVNLGLDLRGGAHLLAEVRVEEVHTSRLEAEWPGLRDRLKPLREEIGAIRLTGIDEAGLHIAIGNPENMERAIGALEPLARTVAGPTGQVGKDLEFKAAGGELIVSLSEIEKASSDDRTLKQAVEIIRRRVDEVGTREPTIMRQGADRILIQVPGIGSAAELKAIIGTTAKLTFHTVEGQASSEDQKVTYEQEVLPDADDPNTWYILEKAAILSGDQLVDSSAAFDQNQRPAVNFRFDPKGAKIFGEYTAEHIGSPFAIVLDGKVLSAPTIQSHISGGSGIITGNFTLDEATELGVLLRAGALPAGLDFLEERTIGPELGKDSIEAGRLACMIAFAGVLLFMVASYGLFGFFANIALVVNVGLIFGLLSMIGATLTLPGIAGIVLTIGMAVDANVLIFERIREELKLGKRPGIAIRIGYEKALSAIVDANITTMLTAIILFIMGSGPVRGFAVTLGIGILTSVFTAIYLTRLIVVTWLERRKPKTIEV